MRHICLYFQVHQPYRLKRYRFFEIGHDHHYFDDFENRLIMERIAKRCYLPANKILLDLLAKHGDKFKVSFSITGVALDQFAEYAPEVLESFKELAATGNVEFLAETYSHSLISLSDKEDFKQDVLQHAKKIEELFGQKPKVFRNTELIYDNGIGETIAEMGFKAMLTEGAKHILGWKSPNRLYYNVLRPELKLLLKNYRLSDDIAFRFSNKTWSEWPLTADKYAEWLNVVDKKDEVVNLFMDYETFGEHQGAETHIFEFLKALPKAVLKNTNFKFATASEIANTHQPVASLNVPDTISWADEERDITAWLGNEMQHEAFGKLYRLAPTVKLINDEKLIRDWKYLQTSDHFYYMSTKISADGIVHDYFNPYNTPYDAFINYMNVLSDFADRLKKAFKKTPHETKEQIKAEIEEIERKLAILKEKLAEPAAIETVKVENKAISKTKKDATPIEKSKPETKIIETVKKEAKAALTVHLEEKKKTKKKTDSKKDADSKPKTKGSKGKSK